MERLEESQSCTIREFSLLRVKKRHATNERETYGKCIPNPLLSESSAPVNIHQNTAIVLTIALQLRFDALVKKQQPNLAVVHND